MSETTIGYPGTDPKINPKVDPGVGLGAGSEVQQGIFEERLKVFTTGLAEAIESEGVMVAVAIIVDPKSPNQPLIYTHGGVYAVARILAAALRKAKVHILEELDA